MEKFRKVLTHRSATETTDLHTIFWDEASQRHSNAAMLYRFSAAESAMRKARRKQLPPVPTSVQELGDVLVSSALFHIHHSGSHKDQFYQSSLVLTDATCLIFAHMKTLQQIERVEEMHLDATVVVQPDIPPSYHLLTMHAVHLHTVSAGLLGHNGILTTLHYVNLSEHSYCLCRDDGQVSNNLWCRFRVYS